METEIAKLNELVGGLVVIGLLGVVALWVIAIVAVSVFIAEKGRRSRTATTDDDWFGAKPKDTVE